MPRYALYFAPPSDTLLWTAGVRWLGRDPESREIVAPPTVHGLSPNRQRQLTESPRRYGWHGTLKAPFTLAEGFSAEDFVVEVERFCARRETFPLPSLRVGTIEGFRALVPAQSANLLGDLAAQCVEFFDALRAPMSAADRARRDPSVLSERQREHLERWGYPYVMDEFRFHMTLTERLSAADVAVLQPWLERYFAEALAERVQVSGVAVFEEPAPGAALRLLQRVGFGG
jgi:putative phosphonate metabolism protein